MKILVSEHGASLWLSARDTREWARRPGLGWPCSFLSGRRLFAQFGRNGDLVDASIDGGRGEQDCDAAEFNAITADFLGARFPACVRPERVEPCVCCGDEPHPHGGPECPECGRV